MITTVKPPKPRDGRRCTARLVRPGSFEGYAPAEEGEGNALRRGYYRALLRYGIRSCLTPDQRETVERYYFEGKTLRALSREMGVSPSALSRRLSEARRRLYRFVHDAAQVEAMLRRARPED